MSKTTKPDTSHDFERGYYCAVSALLREAGHPTTDVLSLMGMGGNPMFADEVDKALFREHGLLPPDFA
jgi:hypothetical protein